MKKIKRKTFVIISTVLDENSARDVQRNINTACVDIESSMETQQLFCKSTATWVI